MIRKTFVWFGIKLYGLIRKLYGLGRNCMVSNHESYGLGRAWGRPVCKLDTCTLTLLMALLYCFDVRILDQEDAEGKLDTCTLTLLYCFDVRILDQEGAEGKLDTCTLTLLMALL